MRLLSKVALVIVALLIASVISAHGYAYYQLQSSTSITGNAIECDYFTVGFYSDAECNVPATGLFADNAQYATTTVSGETVYAFADGTNLASGTIYFMIKTHNHTVGSFTVSTSDTMCTMKNGDYTSTTGAILILDASDDSVLTSPTANQAYSVKLVSSGIASELEQAPNGLDIDFSVVVTDNRTASYNEPASSVTIQSSSSVIVDSLTAAEAMTVSNEGNSGDGNCDYTPSSGEGSSASMSSGTSYDGGYGVTVSQGKKNSLDDHGGKIDVLLNSVYDSDYVIVVRIDSASNSTIVIELADSSTVSIPTHGNSGKTYVICKVSGVLVSQEVTVNDDSLDIATYMQDRTWLDSNTITVHNEESNGSRIVFDVVFKSNSFQNF